MVYKLNFPHKNMAFLCTVCAAHHACQALITPTAGSEASLATCSSAQTSHSTHALSLFLCRGAKTGVTCPTLAYTPHISLLFNLPKQYV